MTWYGIFLKILSCSSELVHLLTYPLANIIRVASTSISPEVCGKSKVKSLVLKSTLSTSVVKTKVPTSNFGSVINAPPNSLVDSITSLNVKIVEE